MLSEAKLHKFDERHTNKSQLDLKSIVAGLVLGLTSTRLIPARLRWSSRGGYVLVAKISFKVVHDFSLLSRYLIVILVAHGKNII